MAIKCIKKDETVTSSDEKIMAFSECLKEWFFLKMFSEL
jgi:hypothetical protein